MAAIEAQRPILGDAVTDVAIGALLDRLTGDEASPHHPRLRQATVLFTDVVGSTSIGATLAHRILSAGGDPRAEDAMAEGMRSIDAEPGPRPGAPDDVGSGDRRRLAAVWEDHQASRVR